MKDLIEVVGGAAVAGPEPCAPQRLLLPAATADWLVMPGVSRANKLICKVARVERGKPAAGQPTISGMVIVFAASGAIDAVIDGPTLTARRTAAVAAHFTSCLARKEAKTLALFGTGALAAPHIEALNIVRPLSEIRVVARSVDGADSFARKLRMDGWNIRAATPSAAAADSDIITTITTSDVPVIGNDFVMEGAHINAMGSYRPSAREIPAETVARAKVVVESRESAWAEAGDLILALDERLITEDHVLADLTEPERIASVRTRDSDLTLFKSVGDVRFDIAATTLLLENLTRPPSAVTSAADYEG